MSDFDSGLPVRTESAGDVAVKIVDATITSQQLTVNADGSINTTVSATNLDIRDLAFASDKVDVTGSTVTLDSTSLAALENITVSLDAGALAALESITVQNGAGASAVNIQDGGNSITVDATDLDVRDLAFATDKVDVTGSTVTLDSTSLAALENITVSLDAGALAALESITVQNGSGASAVNIQDGGNSLTVDAIDLDIRNISASQDNIKISDGTNNLTVNANGSINVVTVPAAITSTNDHNSATVAAGASNTHTYTSAGNFYLTQIEASASGKAKIEVKVNGVTKFVQFNSTSEPNMTIKLSEPILVTSGQTVTIIRTNRDLLSQDIYSTISGHI